VRIGIQPDCRLFVDVDGPELRVGAQTLETAPVVVMVHGGPGFEHSSFKRELSFLPNLAQVVYYDHRGMGRSDRSDPSRWNLEQWADDLDALIGSLGLDRPVVLGHSFGGYVALKYAIEHSDRLAGLILSSAGARFVASDSVAAFLRLAGPQPARIAEAMFARPNDKTLDAYLEHCLPVYNRPRPEGTVAKLTSRDVFLHFWDGENRTFDLRGGLGSITCPVLVTVGDRDPITPPPRAIEVVEGLPGTDARLLLIAGAGHGVYRDVPGAFREAVTTFLHDLPATANDTWLSRR
jgi:proline iminopeptidase